MHPTHPPDTQVVPPWTIAERFGQEMQVATELVALLGRIDDAIGSGPSS